MKVYNALARILHEARLNHGNLLRIKIFSVRLRVFMQYPG